MNITLTSLEALILKATHESLPCPDAAALEAFCSVMKDASEGPLLAAQALSARIHSPNAREALLALTMVDRCMRRCDPNFHSEVGKFRFLNEMIKLVSPKYFAERTAPEVRTKVLQLLHAWSIEYPKETKFKVAYDMLKNQGVIKETPPPLSPEDAPPPRIRPNNSIFEDDEKSKLLQKLLQSKKPEDLQHANRLIKTMVREEERRSEAVSRRAQEVGAALDSAGLLRDMLQRAAEASPDEQQLIHELHASCARLRPVLQRLAGDAAADSLSDILHASDVLDEVCDKYNAFAADKTEPNTPAKPASDSLLDFAGASESEQSIPKNNVKHNVIDELGDIFSNQGATSIAEPLKPMNLKLSEEPQKETKTEGWNELDSLGEQLLKQSLPDNAKRLDSFNSKPTKKIPMNALEKTSPKRETLTPNNGAILDLDFFTKKPEEAKVERILSPNDDVMVDISTKPNSTTEALNKVESSINNILDLSLTLERNTNKIDNKETNDNRDNNSEIKPLNDINVTLQSIQPSDVPPLTAFEENGITVVLHFCKDKPRPDVNVVVISTTSKCKSPIEDYKFQAMVPKGCKVRLLPPSGCSLPAYNPFLPPPALSQVMLYARPRPRPGPRPAPPAPALRFVLTYTADNEPAAEMGEVAELPLI